MPNKIKELTPKNFHEFIKEENAIIDFWASWCVLCKELEPELKSIVKKLDNKAKFGKVNIDDYPELAQEFGVKSLPTLLFFKQGQLIEKITGEIYPEEIIKTADKVF